MSTPEKFREEILQLVGKIIWETPHALTEFYDKHLSREGAKVFALEHCVFADNCPRWFGHMVGNCPHLDVRQYMIENCNSPTTIACRGAAAPQIATACTAGPKLH